MNLPLTAEQGATGPAGAAVLQVLGGMAALAVVFMVVVNVLVPLLAPMPG